jgi:hypothetical protein
MIFGAIAVADIKIVDSNIVPVIPTNLPADDAIKAPRNLPLNDFEIVNFLKLRAITPD